MASLLSSAVGDCGDSVLVGELSWGSELHPKCRVGAPGLLPCVRWSLGSVVSPAGHAPSGTGTGPSWTWSVLHVLREGPAFWMAITGGSVQPKPGHVGGVGMCPPLSLPSILPRTKSRLRSTHGTCSSSCMVTERSAGPPCLLPLRRNTGSEARGRDCSELGRSVRHQEEPPGGGGGPQRHAHWRPAGTPWSLG